MSERTPQRIQRRRTRGWRMPANAVYVGRPTKWGNPFTVKSALECSFAETVEQARRVCVEFFQDEAPVSAPSLEELRGKDLVCWCPLDAPCHAGVLLEWANR